MSRSPDGPDILGAAGASGPLATDDCREIPESVQTSPARLKDVSRLLLRLRLELPRGFLRRPSVSGAISDP